MAKKLKFGSKAYRLKYLGQGKATKKKKSNSRGAYTMARRNKKKSYKSSKFSLKGAIKVLIGASIAIIYEVVISPMIPLSRNMKNAIELGVGLLLLVMPKMPMPVRAFGGALATINLFEIGVPLLANLKIGAGSR